MPRILFVVETFTSKCGSLDTMAGIAMFHPKTMLSFILLNDKCIIWLTNQALFWGNSTNKDLMYPSLLDSNYGILEVIKCFIFLDNIIPKRPLCSGGAEMHRGIAFTSKMTDRENFS